MISLLMVLLLAFFIPFGVTVDESSRGASGSASASVELGSVPDEVDSFLKNAATAMESYAVANGSYEGATFELLRKEGLRPVPDITLEIVTATDGRYCLEAEFEDDHLVHLFHYDSAIGTVELASCGP